MKLVLIFVFLLNAFTSFAEHCCGHPSASSTSQAENSAHDCCDRAQLNTHKDKSKAPQRNLFNASFCGHSCCVSFYPGTPTSVLNPLLTSRLATHSDFYFYPELHQPVPKPPPNPV